MQHSPHWLLDEVKADGQYKGTVRLQGRARDGEAAATRQP